jgi:hypothetical protein
MLSAARWYRSALAIRQSRDRPTSQEEPMSRHLLALAIATCASSAFTQQPPDFSGTWSMDVSRSDSSTHEGFVGPVTWVIRQSPRQLIVDIKRGPKSMTLTYTIYDKPPGAAASGVPSYVAYWSGETLVTETAQNIQGQTVTTKEIRRLQDAGQQMHVERTVQVEHGYTLRRGQNYSTAKDVFTKSAP